MAASPLFLGAPKIGLATIVNADGVNVKDLVTAGASGSKIVSLTCASNDLADRFVFISIVRAAVNYFVGSVKVPLNAGFDGVTPAVDILGDALLLPGLPIDQDGQRYLFLQSGDKLQVSPSAAITSGRTLFFHSVYGDF